MPFSASPARLIVVTNDEVALRPTFLSHATSVMEAGAEHVAFQLRMKRANTRAVLAMAETLHNVAARYDTAFFVNDRVDVAAAVGAGVQLGCGGIPVKAVRGVFNGSIGYSAHGADEAVCAQQDGADFVVLGTIWPSASHVDATAAGLDLVRETSARMTVPLFAIGGVTPPRAHEAIAAGAHGVAVITGVWDAKDPARAVMQYLEAMQVAA